MGLSLQCTHIVPHPLSLSSCHAWHIVVNSICILIHILVLTLFLILVLPTLALVLCRVLRYASPLLFHVSRSTFLVCFLSRACFCFIQSSQIRPSQGTIFAVSRMDQEGPRSSGKERNGKSHIKMALNGFGRRVSASVLLIALSLLSGALILPPAAAQRDENVG